jgi:hypothetical protein
MPFSPSDFEWWMWALFAIGALVAVLVFSLIAVAFDNKNEGGATALFGFFAVIAGIGAAGCAVIALIRFIKWVWG